MEKKADADASKANDEDKYFKKGVLADKKAEQKSSS